MTLDSNTPGPPRPPRPARRRRPRPRTPAGARPWAAGHAVITVLVALGLGTLLNAEAILSTAEGIELDTARRSVAVGIMEPVESVATALRLTGPRTRLDSALGKQDTGAQEGEDVFAAFGGAPEPAPDPAAPGGDTTGDTGDATGDTTDDATGDATGDATEPTSPPSTVDPTRPVTEDEPLLVWVAGDSLSFEYGKAVIRGAESEALLDAIPQVTFEVATGLSRPDVFNWPLRLAQGMQSEDPDIVIFMAGSNDDQSVSEPGGGPTHSCCDASWQAEYGRRVGSVMDQVIVQGRTIVYVGVPIMGGATGSRNPDYQIINDIIEAQADLRPMAHYVDTYALFSNENGHYSQYLFGEKVRADDNVHFERAGGDRLADATFAVITVAFALEDEETASPTESPTSPATSAATTTTTTTDETTTTSTGGNGDTTTTTTTPPSTTAPG